MSDFTMPSLGADMESGTLLEWLVHPGDRVSRGDLMAVVDTDKAAVEIESFADGVVDRLLVEPGTRVPVGAPLALLADGAGASAPPAATPVVAPLPSVPVVSTPMATPPVRHHAEELGVDLATLTGTGRRGQITRGDVTRAAAAAPPPRPAAPAPPPEPEPSGERTRVSPAARRLAAELGVDLSRIRGAGAGGAIREADVRAAAAEPPAAPEPGQVLPSRVTAVAQPSDHGGRSTIAALMSRSKREIPHYYVGTTVDLLATTSWLRKLNRDLPVADRIVPAAALLRAVALGLRQVPELNGFWLDNGFVPGEGVHLGVAVSVRNGALVAPAIHDAADLGLAEVMGALRDVVRRARRGRLTRAELTDPTVTVTDLGDQGVEEVIGVITPPQVALIGIGRIVERPWAVGGLLGVRPVVRMTLSGDHRATDGAVGARFLGHVDDILQRPEEL